MAPNNAVKFFIAKFRELGGQTPKLPQYYRPRPYRNAAIQFRPCSVEDFEERWGIVEETGLNVFSFPAHRIPGCDLLSDSGTTTMTMEQWSQLLLGDEAYGSNEGFFVLRDQMLETFGQSWKQTNKNVENLFLFHQGRAAENALFGIFGRLLYEKLYISSLKITSLSNNLNPELRKLIEDKINPLEESERPYFIIPSNSHFDTTEANIENNRMLPLNIPCEEHVHDDEACPFRGNINMVALKNLLENEGQRVPIIYLTLTNNTGGGAARINGKYKRSK